jgi:hypothetical protein
MLVLGSTPCNALMGARIVPCNAPPCTCRRLDCLAICYLEALQAPPPGTGPAVDAARGALAGPDELGASCSILAELLEVPDLSQLILACGGGTTFCDAATGLLVRRAGSSHKPAHLCLHVYGSHVVLSAAGLLCTLQLCLVTRPYWRCSLACCCSLVACTCC